MKRSAGLTARNVEVVNPALELLAVHLHFRVASAQDFLALILLAVMFVLDDQIVTGRLVSDTGALNLDDETLALLRDWQKQGAKVR